MSFMKRIHAHYTQIKAGYSYVFPYKASDGAWYVENSDDVGYGGDDGYKAASKDNADVYGPFPSENAVAYFVSDYLTSSWDKSDNSGKRKPPVNAPKGAKVIEAPRAFRWIKDGDIKVGDKFISLKDFQSAERFSSDKDVNLPDRTQYEGLSKLPAFMEIEGNLFLECPNITVLPKVYVSKTCNIGHSNIKSLASGSRIKGDLYLPKTVKELPESLEVGGVIKTSAPLKNIKCTDAQRAKLKKW